MFNTASYFTGSSPSHACSLPGGVVMHISSLPPLLLLQFFSFALQKLLQPNSTMLWPGSTFLQPQLLLPADGAASALAAAVPTRVLRRLLAGGAAVGASGCSSESTMVRSERLSEQNNSL
jgi:hypothetical protein